MLSLWVSLAVLLPVAGVFILLLLSPVVVTVDTRSRRMKVRWLALLTYFHPLPGAQGRRRLYIAGMPIPLARPEPKKERRRAVQPLPRRRRPPYLVRLLGRCLRDSEIRRALAPQLVRLLGGMLRSVEWARWQSNLSLPDPALNGILAGALAQPYWESRAQFLFNFTGENALQVEVRLHPKRLAKPLAAFLFRLPYKTIYKRCLAS